MEKKLKVMAARAESAPTSTSSSLVATHWLVRKQKPTNHKKVQRAGERAGRTGLAPWKRQESPRSLQERKGH